MLNANEQRDLTTFSGFTICATLRRTHERVSKIISPRKEAMVLNANLHFGG
jgi:hypothetical protein